MEVKDGCSTSFWSFPSNWYMGCLFDLGWLRGCIDMGIRAMASVILCLADARGGIWSRSLTRLGLLLRTNVLSLLIQRMSLFGNRKKVPIHRVSSVNKGWNLVNISFPSVTIQQQYGPSWQGHFLEHTSLRSGIISFSFLWVTHPCTRSGEKGTRNVMALFLPPLVWLIGR